nr:unnamed protein product [Haemonchus contortus]
MLNLMLYCEQALDYNNCPNINKNDISGGFCFKVHVYKSSFDGRAQCHIFNHTEFGVKERGSSPIRAGPACKLYQNTYRDRNGTLYRQLRCFCAYGDEGRCANKIGTQLKNHAYDAPHCWMKIGDYVTNLLSLLTELPQVTETTTTTEESDETTTTEYYDPGRITTIWITRERGYRRKLKELE